MAEGPPERPGRTPLPHIVVPWAASDQAYKGRAGGQSKPPRLISDREEHAARLSDELESARDAARANVAEVSSAIARRWFRAVSRELVRRAGVQARAAEPRQLRCEAAERDARDRLLARACRGLAAVRRCRKLLHEDRAVRDRADVTRAIRRTRPSSPTSQTCAWPCYTTCGRSQSSSPSPTRSAGGRYGWHVSRQLAAARNAKADDVGNFPTRVQVPRPGAVLRAVAAERAWPWCPSCSPSRRTWSR